MSYQTKWILGQQQFPNFLPLNSTSFLTSKFDLYQFSYPLSLSFSVESPDIEATDFCCQNIPSLLKAPHLTPYKSIFSWMGVINFRKNQVRLLFVKKYPQLLQQISHMSRFFSNTWKIYIISSCLGCIDKNICPHIVITNGCETDWMIKQCAKSCGSCDETSGKIQDIRILANLLQVSATLTYVTKRHKFKCSVCYILRKIIYESYFLHQLINHK